MHGRIPHSTGHVVAWLLVAILLAGFVAFSLRQPAASHLQEVRTNATGDGVEIATAPAARLTALVAGQSVSLARSAPSSASCGPEQLLDANIVYEQPTKVSLDVTSDDGSKLSSRPFHAPWWRVSDVRYPTDKEGGRWFEFDVEMFPESVASIVTATGCKMHSRSEPGPGRTILHYRAPLSDNAISVALGFGHQRKQLRVLARPATWMTRDSDSTWQVREGNGDWYLRGDETRKRHWCQAEQESDAWRTGQCWHLTLAFAAPTQFSIYCHTLVHVELRPSQQVLSWTIGGELRDKVKDESPGLNGTRHDNGEEVRIVHGLRLERCLHPESQGCRSVRVSLSLEDQRLRFALEDIDGNVVSAISLPKNWMEKSGPRCGLEVWQGRLDVFHFESRRT